MKKLAIIGAGIFLIVIAAALIAPRLIDWNDYRDTIENQVETALGRDVEIEGDLSARLLPSPTFSIEGVRIASIPGTEKADLLTLESVDAKLALGPLLRGEYRFRRLVLVNPDIALERMADGRANWDFESDSEETDTQESGIGFDEFAVRGGRLTYRDAQTDERHSLSGMDLVLAAESLERGPYKLDGKLQYQGVPLGLDIRLGRIRDEGATAVSATVDLGKPAGTLTLNGNFSVNGGAPAGAGSLALKGGNFEALMNRIAQFSGAAETAGAAGPLALGYAIDSHVELNGDRLALQDMEFRLRPGKADESLIRGEVAVTLGARPIVQAGLQAGTLDAAPFLGAPDSGALSLAGIGAYRPPTGLGGAVDITIGAVKLDGEAVRQIDLGFTFVPEGIALHRFTAQLPGASELNLEGQWLAGDPAARLSGAVTVSSNNMRGFLDWIGVDAGDVPPGRLTTSRLAANVALDGDRVSLTGIEGKLDTTKVTGSLAYGPGEPSTLVADLRLDTLDFDAYLPSSAGTDSDPSASIDGLFTPLAAYKGRVKLSARELTYDGLRYRGVALDAALAPDRIELARLAVDEVAGTGLSVSGTVKGHAATPDYNLLLAVASDDIMPLLGAYEIALPDPDWQVESVTGEIEFAGRLQERFRLATRLSVNGIALRLRGTMRNAARIESYDLEIDAESPSMAAVSRTFALGIEPQSRSRVRTALAGTVKGDRQKAALNAVLSVGAGKIDATGSITEPFAPSRYNGRLSIDHGDLRQLVRSFGVAFNPADENLGGIDLRTDLAGTPSSVSLKNLAGVIGGVSVEGAGDLALDGARPQLTARLNIGALHLDRFLPPREAGLEKVRTARNAPRSIARWSTEPFNLSFFEIADADLKLSAERIRFARYDFQKPSVSAAFRDGNFILEELKGGLFGGQARVRAEVLDAQPVSVTLSATLSGVSVRDAMHASLDQVAATGTMNFSIDVKGEGASELDLVRSLRTTEKGRLEMRDGVIKGIDLPRMSRSIKNIKRRADFLNVGLTYLSGGESPYQEISADIVIEKGIVRAENPVAVIQAVNSDLSATIDLPNWRVDAKGVFTFVDNPDMPPVSVTVSGPIDSPTQTEDRGKLLNYFIDRFRNPAPPPTEAPDEADPGQSDGEFGESFGFPSGEGQGGEEQPAQPPPEGSDQRPLEERILKGIFESITKKNKE